MSLKAQTCDKAEEDLSWGHQWLLSWKILFFSFSLPALLYEMLWSINKPPPTSWNSLLFRLPLYHSCARLPPLRLSHWLPVNLPIHPSIHPSIHPIANDNTGKNDKAYLCLVLQLKYVYIYYFINFSLQPCEVAVGTPMLQMRKQAPRGPVTYL